MKYHCDVLEDPEIRAGSLKYRRLSGSFDPFHADYHDLVELVAFLQLPGLTWSHAKRLFGWRQSDFGKVQLVRSHQPYIDAARGLHGDNLACQDREDGEKLLKALQLGGWKHGPLPDLVRMAVSETRTAETVAEGAKRLGLTLGQVMYIRYGYQSQQQLRQRRRARQLKGSIGLLVGNG